ncbi:MAG: hypothetical protein KME54_06590 [Tolypothrix brevis GSE-NOS-MK-07-07A]|nr:hypothetical protein [Tolypothrix brevis GSE-NOS-MK-07-07A]
MSASALNRLIAHYKMTAIFIYLNHTSKTKIYVETLYHVRKITYDVKTFRRNVSTMVATFLLLLIKRT